MPVCVYTCARAMYDVYLSRAIMIPRSKRVRSFDDAFLEHRMQILSAFLLGARAYLALTFLRSETVRASARLALGSRRSDPIKRIHVRCLSIFAARTEVELLRNGNALFLLASAGARVPLACRRVEPSSGSHFARSSRIKCRLRGWSWVNRTRAPYNPFSPTCFSAGFPMRARCRARKSKLIDVNVK